MKAFIAICLLVIVAYAQAGDENHHHHNRNHDEHPQLKDKKLQYKKECIDETKVDQELLEKSRKGDFTEDAKFKEYLFCFYRKYGSLNEAGEYQVDVIKAKLTAEFGEEVAKTVSTACTEKTYADKYETAYELARCCYAKTPKKEVNV